MKRRLLLSVALMAAPAVADKITPQFSLDRAAGTVSVMSGASPVSLGFVGAGGFVPNPNVTTTPTVSASFRPGNTTAKYGEHFGVTAADATTPMIGKGIDCDASIQTGLYAVCEYVGMYVHAGRIGPVYTVNPVLNIDAAAGGIPGAVEEFNINNNGPASAIPATQDPLYGASGLPWTTGLNIVPGGLNKITAGLVIDSPGGSGSGSGLMQWGAWIGGNTSNADLNLAGTAASGLRITGTRSSAGIDMSTLPAGTIGVFLPDGGYISSLGSGGAGVYPLISLDGTNTINIGSGTTPTKISGTVSYAGSTPASSSAACLTGTHTWDASYEYVCVATNTWKRAALSAF